MPARKLAFDEPFFREWRNRRLGEKRSVARARRVMRLLDLEELRSPILIVVGSKGKATTATYAAAALAAYGRKVGLVTSPPILENRERIRIDGDAIDESTYADLSRHLAAVLDDLPSSAGHGYLSPSGSFILMGVRHALDVGCDVLVLEAGLGGRSDEVSLFSPQVVAIASIFAEHLDVIGPSVRDVAIDKAGVIMPSTKAVFSVPQSGEVREIVEARAASMGSNLTWVDERRSDDSLVPNAKGLSTQNAWLGIRAGTCLAEILALPHPGGDHMNRILETVSTPGRLSSHLDELGRTWVADAAIEERGARAALSYFELRYGPPTTVFVSIPDSKDIAGVCKALSSYRYVPVRLAEEHLSFSPDLWDRPLVRVENFDRSADGDRILALGTWSFISIVLERLRAETNTAFEIDRG